VMSIIWGNAIFMLFNPGVDFKNYGIPLISIKKLSPS